MGGHVKHLAKLAAVLRCYILAGALVLSGCYSASLLTSPEPTPRGALRFAPAVVARPGNRNLGMNSDELSPGVEVSARYGLHDRFDLGMKVGLFHFDVNSLVLLARGDLWVLSAMPGAGTAWLWESMPVVGLGGGSSEQALDTVKTATHVSALKLPLLFGVHAPKDRVGLVIGPTVHVGYRYCRRITRTVETEPSFESERVQTCTAQDRGALVGAGGHLGVQISAGRHVKLMPEISLLKVVVAPKFREVVIDETRTAMSRGDVLFQFAFAVQISLGP